MAGITSAGSAWVSTGDYSIVHAYTGIYIDTVGSLKERNGPWQLLIDPGKGTALGKT